MQAQENNKYLNEHVYRMSISIFVFYFYQLFMSIKKKYKKYKFERINKYLDKIPVVFVFTDD